VQSLQVRRNASSGDINHGVYSGYTEEDMRNKVLEEFKKRTKTHRRFKYEWRRVEATIEWPLLVGAGAFLLLSLPRLCNQSSYLMLCGSLAADVAPATATRSQRPEGEHSSRKRRATQSDESDPDEPVRRFVRLAAYADSNFALPNSKAKACKAVKGRIEKDLEMEGVHAANFTDTVIPALSQLANEEPQAQHHLVTCFDEVTEAIGQQVNEEMDM